MLKLRWGKAAWILHGGHVGIRVTHLIVVSALVRVKVIRWMLLRIWCLSALRLMGMDFSLTSSIGWIHVFILILGFVSLHIHLTWASLIQVLLILVRRVTLILILEMRYVGLTTGKSLWSLNIRLILIFCKAFTTILVLSVQVLVAWLIGNVIIILSFALSFNLWNIKYVLLFQILSCMVWTTLRTLLLLLRSMHGCVEVGLSHFRIYSPISPYAFHKIVRSLGLSKYRIIVLSSYNWFV